MKFCCKKFAEEVKDGQIEIFPDGTYSVNGCCGGGCWVLMDLKFCPFCGAKVK